MANQPHGGVLKDLFERDASKVIMAGNLKRGGKKKEKRKKKNFEKIDPVIKSSSGIAFFDQNCDHFFDFF